jgi:16S rRNA G527 N7-methylase RsmG
MVEVQDDRGMREAAEALGLEVDSENWSKIAKTLELIGKYSGSLNLTGAGSVSELEGHAVEAMVAVAAARAGAHPGSAWLDVGSGGGFPGLVAAALWAGEVLLVEPRARRAAFLELVVASAGLGAEVRRARVTGGRWIALDGKPGVAPEFGVASARAVFSPRDWVCECAHWVNPGGVCLLHTRADGPDLPDVGEVRGAAAFGGWVVRAIVPRGTKRVSE